jgi:hypothetical protein
MKSILLGTLAVLTVVGGTAATAQPRPDSWQQQRGDWDRDAFWRDAPSDARERIAFLQNRIDRGISDGSLDRREGRRAQQELNSIKRDARFMGRRYNPRQAAVLQQRLDDLGRKLRWQRANANGSYNGSYNGSSSYNGNGGSDWRSDPRFVTQYDASRYYRDGPNYQERRLGAQDEVYRGSDGRYYCKRNDGTTGLIVGAIGGAVLGNVIDGGHERAAGTLLGGALGAILGKSIDQNSDVRCK